MNKQNVLGTLKRHKVLAAIVTLSMLLWATGVPGWSFQAEAANLTNLADTLSDSDLGVVSNHTITFITPTGINPGETVTVTFPAGFNLNGVDFADMDFGSTTADFTLAAAPSGATWGAVVAGQVLTLTNGTGVVGSTSSMVLRIGTNATIGGAGDTQIINPGTAQSYEIQVAGTMDDSGATRVAIIDDVVVTAAVNTTFTFQITGVASSSSINGSATTTSTTTTATSIPFGVLAPNQSKTAAQDLAVATNARNGFIVTLIQDGNLRSSTGADIDLFNNGAGTAGPIAWTTPTNTLGNELTYGHIGFTSEDSSLGVGLTDEFGTDLWAGNLSTTVPREVFRHDGPADGSTAHIGATRVGFQVEIEALQEAGNDYTQTLTYVATPTF